MIDHRNSPGLSTPVRQKDGTLSPVVGKGQIYESATVSCSHCQVVVVLNPLRTRPRHYCAKCDAYICDGCAVVGECRPFEAVIDQHVEATIKRLQEV